MTAVSDERSSEYLRELVPIHQFAAELGRKPSTLKRWVKVYNLPCVRISNMLHVHPPTIRRMLLAGQIATAPDRYGQHLNK